MVKQGKLTGSVITVDVLMLIILHETGIINVNSKQVGEPFKTCKSRCWNASIASMMWSAIMSFLRSTRDFGWIYRKMPSGVVGVAKACVRSVIAGVLPLVILLD